MVGRGRSLQVSDGWTPTPPLDFYTREIKKTGVASGRRGQSGTGGTVDGAAYGTAEKAATTRFGTLWHAVALAIWHTLAHYMARPGAAMLR